MTSGNTTAATSAPLSQRYLTGHCACGEVRYAIRLASSPHLSAYCHCSRCQRFNGAPYIWTSHWDRELVEWYPARSASSSPAPRPPHPSRDEGTGIDVVLSPMLQALAAMPDRKWKLRCRNCGSPMGSWNKARQRWTIYLPTLLRLPSQIQSSRVAWTHNEGAPATAFALPLASTASHEPVATPLQLLTSLPDLDIVSALHSTTSQTPGLRGDDEVWKLVRPDHHQFFGDWRCAESVHDGLEKWDGYRNQSLRVD